MLKGMTDTRPDPATEVVDLCRELIRIDTSNYGDADGPGERKAAEYVATLLDEVGIESRLYESEPGRTSVVASATLLPGRTRRSTPMRSASTRNAGSRTGCSPARA